MDLLILRIISDFLQTVLVFVCLLLQVELSFRTGDIITVFGDMDDDGFYMAELRGHRGLVPRYLHKIKQTDKQTSLRRRMDIKQNDTYIFTHTYREMLDLLTDRQKCKQTEKTTDQQTEEQTNR